MRWKLLPHVWPGARPDKRVRRYLWDLSGLERGLSSRTIQLSSPYRITRVRRVYVFNSPRYNTGQCWRDAASETYCVPANIACILRTQLRGNRLWRPLCGVFQRWGPAIKFTCTMGITWVSKQAGYKKTDSLTGTLFPWRHCQKEAIFRLSEEKRHCAMETVCQSISIIGSLLPFSFLLGSLNSLSPSFQLSAHTALLSFNRPTDRSQFILCFFHVVVNLLPRSTYTISVSFFKVDWRERPGSHFISPQWGHTERC